jgi:hypothetical protein
MNPTTMDLHIGPARKKVDGDAGDQQNLSWPRPTAQPSVLPQQALLGRRGNLSRAANRWSSSAPSGGWGVLGGRGDQR